MSVGWSLPDLRESVYPTPAHLVARRNGGASMEPPASAPNVAVRDGKYGGVPCVVCEPPDAQGMALYFHGGGYRLGSAVRSTPFATRVAGATKHTIITVEYGLAPERPFPAGLRDAVAVYGYFLDRGERVAAMGDSAGGGLAAALTVAAATNGLPLPTALVLMSPWLDLTCQAPTFASRASSDQLFSLESAEEAAAMYLQGHDPTDPLASPGLATLDTWPPALIFASTEEVLVQDSIALTAMLALAGTPVTSYFEAGVPHAWPAVFPDLPASQRAIEGISRFMEAVRATAAI
jgi:monoterpene epsilon-lactone hydrolase